MDGFFKALIVRVGLRGGICAALFVGVGLASIVLLTSALGARSIENVSYFLDPSAERAYMYAHRHFDATDPGRYDLDRASHFYSKALQMNPEMPYVHHELARIAFLRGNLVYALSLIDEEINLPNGPASPASYYIRGLIEGYMGLYAQSAEDYARYLAHDPTNWAAVNDLAWVLLKADKPKEALDAIDAVMPLWPQNPWLLNSRATALFELGRVEEAYDAVVAASNSVQLVKESDWSTAYPGNDPLIASHGVGEFQRAVAENLQTIRAAHKEKTE